MQCQICNAATHPFGRAKILNKYDVTYFQCSQCRFVQTEAPYWLDEAYAEAITGSDVGLVTRNLRLAEVTKLLISGYFNPDAACLDYGGGYGLFVRLMRDTGFNFFWYDKFCRNLFAEGFAGTLDRQYEMLTAFELVEHLVDPQAEIAAMLKLSDSLLFSTELLPDSNPTPEQWWYYAPHEGQHIAIHTYQSLQHLAQQLGLNLYSNHQSLHLLTRKTLPDDLLFNLAAINPVPDRPSLLPADANKIFAMRQNPDQISEAPKMAFSRSEKIVSVEPSQPVKIIVDGVFFQLYKTGIARLWESVIQEWGRSEFSQSIVVLDRNNTCPKIPGIQYLAIPEFSYEDLEADRALLQAICDQENADLFISTYYTTPMTTPSVFMGYDMIPEVLGWDLEQPMWQSKHHAIMSAIAHITISENTAQDLQQGFPAIDPENVHPILCGVADYFKPASQLELMQFRDRYNIQKPYFLLVGASMGYKNSELFLEGLAQLHSRRGFEVICTGGSARQFSAEARTLLPDVIFHALFLEDHELRSAYSGAIALVYPSKYEGFGLPIVEAMKCGCPVITCPNASIPEVGGDAVFYIPDDDIEAMSEALLEVQKPSVRLPMIEAGKRQAQKFTWAAMADQMQQVLRDHAQINSDAIQYNQTLQVVLVSVDWQQSAEQIHDDFLRFFEIICDCDRVANYHFLISMIGTTPESADEIVSSAFMQTLMMSDTDTVEPTIELVDSTDLRQLTVAKLDLASVKTIVDLLDALPGTIAECAGI
jgi:Glycosyl transferases group 1/Methyltransferase domain